MSVFINGSFLNQQLTGAQRYALELSYRLLRRDDYRLVAPADVSTDKLGLDPRAVVKLELSAASRRVRRGWSLIDLPRALRRGDALWSPVNIGPPQVPRHVVTIHDLSVYEQPAWFTRDFIILYRLLLPILARRCAHLLTDSDYSRRQIVERFPMTAGKISVVYAAVDKRFTRVNDEATAAMRDRYKLPDPYVLSLGSIEPRKNLPILLEAWAALGKHQRHDMHLVIAGDRAKVFSDPGIAGLLKRATNVLFTGYFPDGDLPALYSGAAAFVYPSLFEGFGLPPLEAMACGTPVLCSNTTSLPEVVGDAALTFAPTDLAAVVAALEQVVQGRLDGERMAREGLRRAAAFNWDTSANQIAAVFESL